MIEPLPSAPLPARLPAPGGGAAAVVVNWSNFATTGSEGDLGYTLDGEVFETRVSVDHTLGSRFALHGELAYRSLSAGSLDGLIEQWHDFFGLPDGPRRRLPEDQLLLEYRDVARASLETCEDARIGLLLKEHVQAIEDAVAAKEPKTEPVPAAGQAADSNGDWGLEPGQ